MNIGEINGSRVGRRFPRAARNTFNSVELEVGKRSVQPDSRSGCDDESIMARVYIMGYNVVVSLGGVTYTCMSR